VKRSKIHFSNSLAYILGLHSLVAMVDRYPQYISINAELYTVMRIFENLEPYLLVQDKKFGKHSLRFIIPKIISSIVDLRGEMDNYCLDVFGAKRYDEHLAQNTQIHNPKLDPLIDLVKEASFDYI
jgi:hypothetical protein